MTSKVAVENLKKYFKSNQGVIAKLFGNIKHVKAVDGISFEIREGEAFGIAGESGCGKTTTAKTILRLHDPTDGNIYFEGSDITNISGKELKEYRKEAQIIHQDPYESINPRFRVRDWVREPLDVHKVGTKEDRQAKVYETLEKVNLEPPDAFLDSHPADLSGGERQRVAIARALTLEPSLLLADEPASMLDVSIRARVLDLFTALQSEQNITAIYISHDISLLKYLCDRIAIMYLGEIVEVGPTEQIIRDPKHPYTDALVSSVPILDPDIEQETIELEGGIPDAHNKPSGCPFHPRCPERMKHCSDITPSNTSFTDNHSVHCLLYEDEEPTESATSSN